MKKTVLAIAILLAVLSLASIFASVKAGVDFNVDARGNISTLGVGPDSGSTEDVLESEDFTKLHVTAKPYFASGYWDVAGKFDFGYDSTWAPGIFGERSSFDDDYEGFYSTLEDFVAASNLLQNTSASSLTKALGIIGLVSQSTERVVFNNGVLKLGFVRDGQMDVTTLGTGKYTKSTWIVSTSPRTISGTNIYYPGSYVLVDPELSAIFSVTENGFRFSSFAGLDNLPGLMVGEESYSADGTAGAEAVLSSFLADGLAYRVSAIGKFKLDITTSDTTVSWTEVSPEFGLTYETDIAGNPITLSVAAETRFTTPSNAEIKPGIAIQAGAELALENKTVSFDGYVVKNDKGSDENAPLFRGLDFGKEIGIGGDVEVALDFANNGKAYVGTGVAFALLDGFKFAETSNTDLMPLDYLKAGVRAGTDKWFAFDVSMNGFWATLNEELSVGETPEFFPWDMFKFSAAVGSDFQNGSWQFNLATGPKFGIDSTTSLETVDYANLLDVLDLYGSFKLTYKLGN